MKASKAEKRRPSGARRASDRKEVRILLSRRTLENVSRLADRSGKALPEFLSEVVDDLVEDRAGYDAALRRLERRLKDGIDLGTGGAADWTRDELHAR